LEKILRDKDGSNPPIVPYGAQQEIPSNMKKQIPNKDDSKSPDKLYGAEKELLDLLKRKFAHD